MFVCVGLLKILCNLLAVDGINDPDVLAINAGKHKHNPFCTRDFFLIIINNNNNNNNVYDDVFYSSFGCIDTV